MRRTKPSLLLAFLVISSLLTIAAPTVLAQNTGADGPWGVFEPLSLVVKPIIHLFTVIGGLDQDTMAAVTRFVIWLVVFALVYGGLSAAGQQWLTNNIKMVLGFAFATISAIFMPPEWIMQIGSGWAQVAFIVMTIPILLVVLVFAIKTWDSQPILSMACWFLLSGLLLYYRAAMGITKPDNNVMGGWTGIIAIVVQYALVIVLIALIISVIKAIGSLGGMGAQGAFGSGFGGWKNWFTPRTAGGNNNQQLTTQNNQLRQQQQQTQQRAQQLVQDIANLEREMVQQEANVNAIRATPVAARTAVQWAQLDILVDQLIQNRQRLLQLQTQATAVP